MLVCGIFSSLNKLRVFQNKNPPDAIKNESSSVTYNREINDYCQIKKEIHGVHDEAVSVVCLFVNKLVGYL
jgi:hypothetical protein